MILKEKNMIISNQTAIDLLRDLSDKLSKRFANSSLNTFRQAFDSNQMPMLFISQSANEAEGQPVIAIRISNVSAVSNDVFGNAMNAYAPHVLELAFEAAPAPAIGPIPALSALLVCEAEAVKTGVELQVKAIANGTAITAAAMDAAAAIADVEDLYWPTKSV
jgi:hypothetical protein